MPTIKERLEAVWNNYDCICPSNLICWNDKQIGYSRVSRLSLWYKKGKRYPLLKGKQRK